MPPQLQTNNDGVTPPKPEAKVLSLLLKVVIMTLITSVFLLFLGLATALLLLHLCLASRAIHRRRRHASFPVSSSGFSTHDLDKLSQFRFNNWVRPQSQNDCVVCLESFRDGQWCRKLCSCGHVFHRKCVDSWLVKVSSCPICRTRVQFDIGGSGSGSVMGGAEEDERKEFWGFGRFVSC